MGGYLTVAEFVEKYKDRYDIIYANGNLTYEEAAKDQLLQSYTFVGDSSKNILVQIENRTTTGGEDKIPLFTIPRSAVRGKRLETR